MRERTGNVDNEDASTSNTPSLNSGKRNKHNGDRRNDKKKNGADYTGVGDSSKKRKLPSCLNPKCNEEHFIKDCENTTEEMKKRLVDVYRAERRAKKGRYSDNKDRHGTSAGRVNLIRSKDLENHSTLFSASLNAGAIETVVMTDQGSDINAMPDTVFKLLRGPNSSNEVVDFPTTKKYSTILRSKDVELTCSKKVKVDVTLRIRHGSKIMLRDVWFHVANEDIECILLGREDLAALGLDNKLMMQAAADRLDGVAHMPTLLQQHKKKIDVTEATPIGDEEPPSIIAGLLENGIYHSEGGAEADFLEETDVYIDLGEYDPADLTSALQQSVTTAVKNGLSTSGGDRLSNLLSKYRQVFD